MLSRGKRKCGRFNRFEMDATYSRFKPSAGRVLSRQPAVSILNIIATSPTFSEAQSASGAPLETERRLILPIRQRWPENWLEIHPDDAKARGIESGDRVRVESDDVLVQTGGWVGVEEDDFSYTGLEKAGHLRIGKGAFEAVAVVTEAVRPGLVWTNFLHTGSPANSLVPRVPDPITNRYRFKLGEGRVCKIGESGYKTAFDKMSFVPRTIV